MGQIASAGDGRRPEAAAAPQVFGLTCPCKNDPYASVVVETDPGNDSEYGPYIKTGLVVQTLHSEATVGENDGPKASEAIRLDEDVLLDEPDAKKAPDLQMSKAQAATGGGCKPSPRRDSPGGSRAGILNIFTKSVSSLPSNSSAPSNSSGDRGTAAQKRLKKAVTAVKMVNRMTKTVRFQEETVVYFEVGKEASDKDFNGFVLGDKVKWVDADDDVPEGSIGVVTAFRSGGILQVKFAHGSWDYRATELLHQAAEPEQKETWSTGVARVALGKAEQLMRAGEVLEAEAALAQAISKLEDAVCLEGFEPDLIESYQSVHSSLASTDGSPSTNRLERSPSGLSGGSRSPGMRRASKLSQSEAAEAKEALDRMVMSAVYKDVTSQVKQYLAWSEVFEVSRLMSLKASSGFQLAWESNGDQLWVSQPLRESWIEFRLIADLGDASLAQCLAYYTEQDLHEDKRKKKKKGSIRKPMNSVAGSSPNVVAHTLTSEMAGRREVQTELFRWFNMEFGFFGESLRPWPRAASDGSPWSHLWEVPRRAGEMVADCSVTAHHLWIPRGGDLQGTVAVQLVRVDWRSCLARWALNTWTSKKAELVLSGFRTSIARASDPSGAYAQRIKTDRTGFYAKLRKVESAAAQRSSISVQSLPDADVLRELRVTAGKM